MATTPNGNVYGNWSDGPALTPSGLHRSEAGMPGAGRQGYVPPEHPVRAIKGDLGNRNIRGLDSRPSFESPGVPYQNLTDGRK